VQPVQCLRGLRRRSAAACLLRLWVRPSPGSWMFVCCECCVLSDRGLCDELITVPEESYVLWCVVVCDLGILRMRRPWPALARSATGRKWSCTSLFVCVKLIVRTHWLSSKGPNYQRGVLLISAGEIEGYFEGKTPTPWKGHEGNLVIARQCPGSPGTCNPEETGLRYSPDMVP
jgi:hypothetical protein